MGAAQKEKAVFFSYENPAKGAAIQEKSRIHTGIQPIQMGKKAHTSEKRLAYPRFEPWAAYSIYLTTRQVAILSFMVFTYRATYICGGIIMVFDPYKWVHWKLKSKIFQSLEIKRLFYFLELGYVTLRKDKI